MTTPPPPALPLADSTVAMSVYNVLAHAARGLKADDLMSGLRAFGMPQADERQVARCLAHLDARGWIVTGARLRVIDPKRRLVRTRNRNDPSGWGGWTVKDPSGHFHPLESIVEQMRSGKGAA